MLKALRPTMRVVVALSLVGLVTLRGEPVARAAQTNSWSAVLGDGQSNASVAADTCGQLGTTSAVNNAYANPLRILRSGTDVYVVGCFKNWAGVAAADYIAKWDGTTWSSLGDNGAGNGAINAAVYDAAVYKGNLVIAGAFTDAGGDSTADMIARWTGTAWEGFAIGTGCGGPCSPKSSNEDYATALEVDTKGNGDASDDALIIGGRFAYGISDGTAASGYQIPGTINLARWTGTTYEAVDDSNPFDSYAKSQWIPTDFAFVGASLYMGTFRLDSGSSFSSYSANKELALQKLGTDWGGTNFGGSAAGSGSGWGVSRLAVKSGKLYVGGNFADAGGVSSADILAVLDPAGPTWADMHGATPSYVTNWGVNSIEVAGSQVIVSAPGGAFGTQRWTGAEWLRVSTTTASAVLYDENFSGSSDRLLFSAITSDIAGIAAADFFASLTLNSAATLDAATSTNSSPALAFDGSTSYNLSLPADKCSETLVLTTSDSGAAYAANTTVSVAPGASASLSVKVVSSDAATSSTYTFNISRLGTATIPTTGTAGASSVTSNSATVSASFNPNGQAGSYYFEYSTNADMSGASQTSVSNVACTSESATVSASLWSLTGGTTYYVRLVGTNATGPKTGTISSFSTTAPIPVASAATSVGTTTATLNGTVNPSGSSTNYYFEYGTTLSYGSRTAEPAWGGQTCFGASAGSGSGATARSANVSGLTPNTTYYFRLVACWSVGWPAIVKQSAALSFTTASVSTSTDAPSTSAETSSSTSESSTSAPQANDPSTTSTIAPSTDNGTTTSVAAAATTSSSVSTTVAVSTSTMPDTTIARALSVVAAVASVAGKTLSVKVAISPITKSVTATGLPAGTKFNPKTGLISGKPTKKGSYSVTVSGIVSGKRITVKVRITVK